jgi:hypothetical protein
MMGDTVQMQMIRRYARILREQQPPIRGRRIGARERRLARERVVAARDAADSTVRGALHAIRGDGPAVRTPPLT